MAKVKYVVYSIREYDNDGKGARYHVRVDQRLYEGEAWAEMDNTVYDFDDFMDIHKIYLKLAESNPEIFGYDFTEYTKHLTRLKQEMLRLGV